MGTIDVAQRLFQDGPLDTPQQSSYRIINWIDSKAMFADEITFEEHMEQFQGYMNRYGRGLIIYWFGYVDTIVSMIHTKYGSDMLTVTHSFPNEILLPTGEKITLNHEV